MIVQSDIEKWYQEESAKVILQARTDECNSSEKVRIFHHELHRKRIVKSSILKLQTEQGILQGHEACARYLEGKVEDLLLTSLPLDQQARDSLLLEIEPVFTDTDNTMLEALPTYDELHEVVRNSHHLASPGTDSIPSLLYHICWDTVGPALFSMVQAIFNGAAPTKSQQTSMMVFGAKPKYPHSLDPGHKRRISLINSDMKLVTGIDAKRFHATATHTLSPLQLVARSDRRIHHGICRARDAIQAAGRGRREGCGMLDTDFEAGFDFLDMDWTYLVLLKKNCSPSVVNRLKRVYANNVSMVVVNSVLGKKIPNKRGSLKQGDIPSMYYFSVGLDPVLYYLERQLQGIPVYKQPVAGPVQAQERGNRREVQAPDHAPGALAPVLQNTSRTAVYNNMKLPAEEVYKLCAYADDLKCGISFMQEFYIVIHACTLLERAGGVKLHRSLHRDKVRFLALGRWKGTLQQEDIPFPFIKLSEQLDFIGVTLTATFMQTRRLNCEVIEKRVCDTVNAWRGGKFMSIVERGHSVNTYAFSKAVFRCSSIPLRAETEARVHGVARVWMMQDCYEKPAATVLHRAPEDGGLGLYSMRSRALAMLLRTFCELACNPSFRSSEYLAALWRSEVLGEWCGEVPPSPYYSQEFFSPSGTTTRIVQ